MRKPVLTIVLCLAAGYLIAQSVGEKLAKAYQAFEKDPQLKNAVSSLYVIDAASGQIVFDKNSRVGLAPASSQKIITAATAFDILGSDYRYRTMFYVSQNGDKQSLTIRPSGDPAFGSWRWTRTNERYTLSRIIHAIKTSVTRLSWPVFIDGKGWEGESIPNGWIWQDIGNYYGAGAESLNWRENQFDIKLQSGDRIGDTVKITGNTAGSTYRLTSFATAAAKGSGDNAYVYFPMHGGGGVIRGTIPVNEKAFTISAAYPSGLVAFRDILVDSLQALYGKPGTVSSLTAFQRPDTGGKLIHTELSPPLDSLIYWFLKKSINLYGEALMKTMAYEKKGSGITDTGVAIVKDFWKAKGLDPDELNIYDGSGLSPLNRVTTRAQVEILKYAGGRAWFRHFYAALPEYNGMKIKSGTISDVKAFCGYHKSRGGTDYILAFIVNNYSGNSSTLVNKMYRVLDILK